ncbi:MAG: methyltransferase domain-containing protein, partial [Planctomycetota bacterium]
MNLQRRHRQDEWMDDPDLAEDLHHGALRGLSRVNRMSGVSRSLWKLMHPWINEHPERPIRVLDVACGGGDVAIGLKRLSQRKNVELEITGCDISPRATAYATNLASQSGLSVEFQCRDVLAEALPGSYDIVYTSLFLHHLEEDSLRSILRSMKRVARHRILLSDLIR